MKCPNYPLSPFLWRQSPILPVNIANFHVTDASQLLFHAYEFQMNKSVCWHFFIFRLVSAQANASEINLIHIYSSIFNPLFYDKLKLIVNFSIKLKNSNSVLFDFYYFLICLLHWILFRGIFWLIFSQFLLNNLRIMMVLRYLTYFFSG